MSRRRARSCASVSSAARRGRPRRRRCWSRKATSRFPVVYPGRTYDISPDGQRFLMIKEGGGADQTAAPPQHHRRAALGRGAEAPRADAVTMCRKCRLAKPHEPSSLTSRQFRMTAVSFDSGSRSSSRACADGLGCNVSNPAVD